MKKTIITILFIGAIVVGWYLISPLFINTTVNEELPIDFETTIQIPAQEESFLEIDTAKQLKEPVVDGLAKDQSPINEANTEFDNLVQDIPEPQNDIIDVDQIVDEPMADMPFVEPNIETRGSFVGADAQHQGSGSVKVLSNGVRTFLRFEDFSVTNGPDLFVTLNKGNSPKGEHVIVERLKGNKGDQNYDISDYNLDDYESVSIYCRAFSVEFATAQL